LLREIGLDSLLSIVQMPKACRSRRGDRPVGRRQRRPACRRDPRDHPAELRAKLVAYREALAADVKRQTL